RERACAGTRISWAPVDVLQGLDARALSGCISDSLERRRRVKVVSSYQQTECRALGQAEDVPIPEIAIRPGSGVELKHRGVGVLRGGHVPGGSGVETTRRVQKDSDLSLSANGNARVKLGP